MTRRRSRTRWGTVVLLAAMTVMPSHAGPAGEEIAERCIDAGAPEQLCALVLDAEEGLARTGVSAGDFTDDDRALIEIADFYFAPRASIVRDGQTVVFTNDNRAGGNRHSVSSADLGGNDPVLPVPGASFGGGRAFRSGRLEPGDPFVLTIDIATMDPRAYVPLPTGGYLIGYFCYIHGASQMNGQLLVSAG